MRTAVRRFALDGVFWRRVARLGASRAPGWFVRLAPPLVGMLVALAAPVSRRRIAEQLDRVRGPVGFLRGFIDVACTFASFASCLAEVLSTGSKNEQAPIGTVHRNAKVDALLAAHGGAIFATAHTAGWEIMAALLAREQHRHVMIVMQRERDAAACELNDSLRAAHGGLSIVHVGSDPLASLPLLRQLRHGRVVALQIDRVPDGMRCRAVKLFGRAGTIPEGPLLLAQLAGVPIVPVFSSRTGHRRYEVHFGNPVTVPPRADRAAVDSAAQELADALSAFVAVHPTQWFAFHA